MTDRAWALVEAIRARPGNKYPYKLTGSEAIELLESAFQQVEAKQREQDAKVCRDHAKLVQTDIGKALLLQELADLFENGPKKIHLNAAAIRQ